MASNDSTPVPGNITPRNLPTVFCHLWQLRAQTHSVLAGVHALLGAWPEESDLSELNVRLDLRRQLEQACEHLADAVDYLEPTSDHHDFSLAEHRSRTAARPTACVHPYHETEE